MVQFHNAPSNFAKLASGETGIGYQSPQAIPEKWEKILRNQIVPIMMPNRIGYKISTVLFICTYRRQDDQNWYSWSHEMRFKNYFLELVSCDIHVRHADKYWIRPNMLALRWPF